MGIPLRLDPRHDPARDGDGVAAGGVAHHRDCVLQMLKAEFPLIQHGVLCAVCCAVLCAVVCVCVCVCCHGTGTSPSSRGVMSVQKSSSVTVRRACTIVLGSAPVASAGQDVQCM